MSFVYPQFLFGLLALGIPIIIHLFNFRKAKRIYFSSNLFLKNVKKASSTRLKIKHYLILLSRLLFIAFLVFTFAQPFIPAEEKNLQTNQVALYLDNSYSMSNNVQEDLTAFEASIAYMQTILDIYPQNTDVLLLTNDFAPYSNTPKSKNEIRELITEIDLSGISRTAGEIKNRLGTTNQSSRPLDIYWLSDFQQSTTGDLAPLHSDTLNNIFLIPLAYQNLQNVYVDSLFLSNPFLIQGETNEVNVVLKNDGPDEINDLMIRFFLNGAQSASGTVDIDPYGLGEIAFDISFQLEEYNEGLLSFEDFPVTFDNDFYFTLNQSDRISVIELKETDSTTVIEKVFGNQQLFDFSSYNINNIDYNDLQTANLIILNEISSIEPTVNSTLMQFMDRQGDILLIPSPDMEVTSFASLTGTLQIIPDSISSREPLAGIDLNNPFFADIFESRTGDFDMPSARPLLGIPSASAELVNFRDGRDFLSYRESVNRLYLTASPLQLSYTDFHTHAVFVPIMYRVALLSKKEFNRLYYTLGQSVISVGIDSVDQETLIKLQGENKEIIPGQRFAGNQVFLEIPKFELEPGFYKISINDVSVNSIAFNQRKAESKLAQIGLEELESISEENSSLTLFNAAGIDNFDNEIKEKYLGIPLWRYTLILTLIFLLAEIMIIRFL